MALLGLTLALVTVSAGHASASSWHKTAATVAKKKCKKKGKKSAAVAKKKKCKKKHPVTPVTPAPPQQRGPIARLDLTWSGDAEIDAHAWSSGLHDGWNEVIGEFQAEIPGTTYESFSDQERITELNPNPIRPITFGICYYAGPDSTDAGTTSITVKTVFTDGRVETDTLPAEYGDSFTDNLEQGGPTDPIDDWCPFVL